MTPQWGFPPLLYSKDVVVSPVSRNFWKKLEDWKIGMLEGWKAGRLEGWKIGRLEGWKVGRLEG